MKLNSEVFKSHIYLYGQMIFNKDQGQFNGEKKDFSANNAGIFGYPYVKFNQSIYLSHTVCENTKRIIYLAVKL